MNDEFKIDAQDTHPLFILTDVKIGTRTKSMLKFFMTSSLLLVINCSIRLMKRQMSGIFLQFVTNCRAILIVL